MAKELGVTYRALQKRLKEWLKTDPAFANFHYLGKHRPTITLDEFAEMKERVSANPLEVKSHIRSDLNEKRATTGKKSVAKTTFYRGIGQATLSQFCQDKPYQWFERTGIRIPPNYSVEDARKSFARLLAIDRLIEYIRHGKITFPGSYLYQDLGARIKDEICDDKEFLTPEILEKLISGNYEVDISPLYDVSSFTDAEEDELPPSSW